MATRRLTAPPHARLVAAASAARCTPRPSQRRRALAAHSQRGCARWRPVRPPLAATCQLLSPAGRHRARRRPIGGGCPLLRRLRRGRAGARPRAALAARGTRLGPPRRAARARPAAATARHPTRRRLCRRAAAPRPARAERVRGVLPGRLARLHRRHPAAVGRRAPPREPRGRRRPAAAGHRRLAAAGGRILCALVLGVRRRRRAGAALRALDRRGRARGAEHSAARPAGGAQPAGGGRPGDQRNGLEDIHRLAAANGRVEDHGRADLRPEPDAGGRALGGLQVGGRHVGQAAPLLAAPHGQAAQPVLGQLLPTLSRPAARDVAAQTL
mmetsp:Transcript_10747/g.31628  ORF Transcript_10747/g.31628 Transcript_10747/m.31628 type:complete len:328 (-) Transcript_10747:296-1279(-)